MLEVIGCITGEHSIGLVIVAASICVLASYTVFSLMARADHADESKRIHWYLGVAFVAGSGVWATHFVAMLAYMPGLPVSYDAGQTVVSVLLAIGISGLGFFITTRPKGLVLGGAIIGLAIVAMHYTGMAALRLPARPEWQGDYMIASLIISMSLSVAALFSARRLPSLTGRLAATGFFTLAIVGLHFTAMTAVTYVPDPTIIVKGVTLEPQWMAGVIAAVTLLIVGLGLVGSLADQARAQRVLEEADRLRDYVHALEATKSELEKTASQLQIALTKAEAASEAKGLFLSTMSHELRTPLNAIIGFSEILQKEMFGPIGNEHYKTYFTDIHESGKILYNLINDILDITHLDAGRLVLEKDEIETGDLIELALRQKKAMAAQSNIALSLEMEEDLPHIMGDERRLLQILGNLLSNALKFTPEGGKVDVTAKREAGRILIRIQDTGIGMAAEQIPVALERFGQIDGTLARRYEGTGIGLPLAKLLTELHGGALTLESELGKGTLVTLSFPALATARAQKPDNSAQVA